MLERQRMAAPLPKPNKSILDSANEVIYGDREKTYGDPGKNLRVIAEFWETYLQARGFWGADRNQLTAEDVCHMMNLLKTARLANTPGHIDSLVDICGYTALVERINANFNTQEGADPKAP